MTEVLSGRYILPPPAPEDLADISAIAEAEAGLAIGSAKSSMVQSRLASRLRRLGLADYRSYVGLLKSEAGAGERAEMISALTTNVSHFFREAHHFELLRDKVLPGLVSRARAGGRVRLWSAGCARGQEPYSIALDLLARMPDAASCDIRILATDIDRAVLSEAALGKYDEDALAPLTPDARQHFERSGSGWRASPGLRRLVTFRVLNLHEPWPMNGQFDAIFCRNVVIYFTPARQSTLWPRFARALCQGGWLFVGHSERVPPDAGLQAAGVTAYRKTA